MDPTNLKIALVIGLVFVPAAIAALVWVHRYESGYYLHKRIDAQAQFVAELARAYETHPLPDYKARLERETAKLEALRSKS